LFFDTGIWVLISFLVFVGAFGRKLWSAMAGQLDTYIDKAKAQIAEAENLKLEATELLRAAEDHQKAIDEEVNKIKEAAQKEIATIEATSKKSLADLSARYEEKLNSRINDEIARQKQKLMENAFDSIANEIVKKVRQNPDDFDFSLSNNDWSVIVKEVNAHEVQ
jgi:F-type H+-transporting ATPase subunit b